MNETTEGIVLMSVAEASTYSGLTVEIIRRGIAVGDLPVYRHWSDIRFHKISKADLDEAMTQMEPRRKKAHNGDGSLRQRADGRFEFRVTQIDGTRKSFYGKSADEALTKSDEVRP